MHGQLQKSNNCHKILDMKTVNITVKTESNNQGVQRKMVLALNFFVFLKFKFFGLLLLYLT